MNMQNPWIKAVTVFALMGLQACVTATSDRTRPASLEDQAEANLNLGVAYMRQGRADLALDRLERALEQNPRLANAHSTIALAYDQLGDAERAEVHYRRATQLEPGNPAAANSYAVFLCRGDRWREAEPYFKRAANNARYATPAVALTNAGVCAREAGDLQSAESYFRSALTRDSAFGDALLNMGEISYEQQNFLQTRAFVQRYLAAHAATPGVLWLCFNAETRLDEPERARECAQRLRREFPESAEMAQLQQIETNSGR
jgi:type IV pilus assembly protein PilF